MNDLVKGATPEQVAEFLKTTFSQKRADRSVAKLEKYPASGVFTRVGTHKTKIDGKEILYPVVFIHDGATKTSKEIGHISFSSIHRFIATGKTQQVQKVGSKYIGRYMNATEPMHPFSKNKSEAEVIASLLGKAYTAEDKKVKLAVVDYDEANDFVNSICLTEAECADYIAEKDVCFITVK